MRSIRRPMLYILLCCLLAVPAAAQSIVLVDARGQAMTSGEGDPALPDWAVRVCGAVLLCAVFALSFSTVRLQMRK